MSTTSDVRKGKWVSARIQHTTTAPSVFYGHVVMVEELACGHVVRLNRSTWLSRGKAHRRRCAACTAAADASYRAPRPAEADRRTGPRVVMCRIVRTVRSAGTSPRGGQVCTDYLACGNTVRLGAADWQANQQHAPQWRRCEACTAKYFPARQ